MFNLLPHAFIPALALVISPWAINADELSHPTKFEVQ